MYQKQNQIQNTGKLPYRMTNDYLFRAVFQTRPKALEGLCRAVLHLSSEDTLSVTLLNPIELGKEIESKEFILDLALLINQSIYLNLEMQVYNDRFWPERSLSYVCRSYDNLNHGKEYRDVLPVVHVGFLNFTLFPEAPEFYATYRFVNVKNQKLYSDKLCISVVDLTRIELATEEDKKYEIDLWARVFKATTWEEVNALAEKNEYLQEVVSGVRQLTEDEYLRQRMQAREDYEYWERIKKNYYQREIRERDEKIRERDEKIREQDEKIQEQRELLQRLEKRLQQLESRQ